MRRYLLVALVPVLVAILVGSCTEGDGEGESDSWQPCERSTGAVPHATGARDAVLRIGGYGGLPPPSFMPDSIPDLTLYGNGRLIGIDQSTAERLVPGLAERQLTKGEVRWLLHGAEVECLLERDAFLDLPGTADVPGIAFDVNTDSGSHRTFAIGLGWSEMDPNVPAEQKGQRAALIDFMNGAFKLLEGGGATPIPTARLGVFFSVVDAPPTPSDWPSVTWPLDRPLATFGEGSPESYPNVHCAVATGEDALALLAAVEDMPSGQLPYWQDGKSWYDLELRPMLPDESDCVALVA